MTREEIFQGLKEVLTNVRPQLDLTSVSMSSRLLEDLALDSLSMLLLSLAIEQKYNFQFEDQVQFKTVGDVIDYAEKALMR